MTKTILGLAVSLLLASAARPDTCPTYALPAPVLHFHGTNCSSPGNPIGACGLDGVTFSLETSPGVPYVLQSCETSVLWDFGDGTTQTTSGVTVVHTFPAAGSFVVHGMVMAGSTYINHDASSVDVANGVAYVDADQAVTVQENAGPAVVHVRTTFAPTTVDYFTDDFGRGYSGTRYTPVHGTVSFAAGEYDKTVSIPIIDDSIYDGRASFNLQLANPTNGVTLAQTGIGPWPYPHYSLAVAVFIEDDESPSTFDFAGTFPIDVPESAGTFNATVVRSGDLSQTVSLSWSAGNASGTLTFNPNETQKTIAIPIPHDNLWEPPRPQTITISAPTNGGIIAGPNPASKTVQWTIVDDPATLTATPDSVAVRVGDSATIALMFSPPPASPLVLPVQASNEKVQVPPTVSIDSSGAGTLVIQSFAPGIALVTVTNPAANAAGATIAVQVGVGMFVTSIEPATGPTSGGTQVTLSGQNFSPACVVSFGDASATSTTFGSPMSLTATTPVHPPGAVDVTVTCGTEASTVTNGFRYVVPARRRPVGH